VAAAAVRARALHCLASLAFTQADYRASTRYGQQSLSLRSGTGDQAGIAWSYTVLAFTAGFGLIAAAGLGAGFAGALTIARAENASSGVAPFQDTTVEV